jgi:hypothetical protein
LHPVFLATDLLIARPDTLLRWHRDLFRREWRHRSRRKKRQPRVAPEPLYIFAVVELQTRRIVHAAVTRSPADDQKA